MTAKIIQLENQSLENIPELLRTLANETESGEFGVVRNLAWVLESDRDVISHGLCGRAGEPHAVAHWLHGMAMRGLTD